MIRNLFQNIQDTQVSSVAHPVLELRNIPQTNSVGSNFLAWTDTELFRVSGQQVSYVSTEDQFVVGPRYNRWAVTLWYDGFWFTNPLNPLVFTRGSNVLKFIDPNIRPSGKYLEEFYDHLLIGAPTINGVTYPNRVMWCDLRNADQWNPDLTNESDFYDFVSEDELSQFSFGCTGMKKITAGTTYRQRDYIVVYFPRNIKRLMYVGGKLVMQQHTSNDEIGCAFPYSVTGYSKLHAFIGEENFYSFDGFDPKIIGDQIKDYFFDDLSTNGDWRYRTYGYINKNKSELVWVYISKAQDTYPIFDKCVIWNFREDEWSVAQAENYHCALEVSTESSYAVINTHDEIINTNTTIINDVDLPSDFGKQFVYGTANKVLLREATSDDDARTLVCQNEPYVITKDFTYDDLQHVKEIDQVTLHCDYDPITCCGVEVALSARKEIGDPVSFVAAGKLWTKDRPQERQTLPRVSGRIFRFRFTWKKKYPANAVMGAKFWGWGENVLIKDAMGKPREVVQ